MDFSHIAIWLFAGMVLALPADTPLDRKSDGLSVAIVVDKDESGAAMIKRTGVFHVAFTNKSGSPIRLWSELCQLGYETISFEVDDGDGPPSKMYKHRPHPSNWKNKPPRTIMIPPRGTFSLDVRLSEIWGERVWKGAPEPNTGKPVTLTAILEIKPTDASKDQAVWTGRIASEPITALVVDKTLRTPLEYLWADCPKQALTIMEADHAWINKTDSNQQTPLHLAARGGFVEVARWLLAQGANVNARAYNKFTPLHCADDPQIVELLIENNADVNAKNSSARTALEDAASDLAHAGQITDLRTENLRTVIDMLRSAGAEYDIRSACYLDDIARVQELLADKGKAQDKQAMRAAATLGRTNIVRLLLEHGADPEDADYSGLTVSYFAIEHAEVLKLLFDAGADPIVRVEYHGSGHGPQGTSLLHVAAGKGAIESATLLVSLGNDVNRADVNGGTPLDEACVNGHGPMVEWLLQNKADPNQRGWRHLTPLELVSSQIRPDQEEDNARFQHIIRLLEQSGVEINLGAAIACNDIAQVAEILQKNPKVVSSIDSAVEPALHRAVTLDHLEIAKLLLERGADPNIRSYEGGHEGGTALLTAAFWGRLEIAELLIEHGANINTKSARGVVPLHEAARMGHDDLARLLLEHGADVNAKDIEGKTPMEWAGAERQSTKTVELLRAHGAK